MVKDNMTLDQSQWIAALTALPKPEIIKLASELSVDLDPQPAALPRAGLQLLTMKDGVNNEPYFLGEIPVATAHVSLLTQSGERVEGAANVLDTKEDYAMSLAILDGVMRHNLPRYKEVEQLIEKGWQKRKERDTQRGQVLSRTKVDFSLMSEGQ